MPIFQWILRAVLAILPFAIFQTVQEVFDDVKLSALSALIFAQFYFTFNDLNWLIRQGVAELFLVLTIYSLVKVYKAKNQLAYSILTVFSVLGLVVSHYTIDYFSIIIFVGIFVLCGLISYLPKKLLSFLKFSSISAEKQVIDKVFLIFLICVSLFWIYFTDLIPFLTVIHNQIYNIRNLIITTPGQVASTTPTPSWFLNNPAGPVVGFWLDFTLVLIPLGFLFLFFKSTKRPVQMPWIWGGLISVVMVGVWVLAGTAVLAVFVDRVILFGFPFFCSFIAVSMLLFNKKLLLNKKRAVRIFAVVFLIMFLMINLPLNMIIPDYTRYVLYQPRDSVNPAVAIKQGIIGVNEYTASIWLDQHGSENVTYWTDWSNDWFYAAWDITISGNEKGPINSTDTYFLLNHYNLQFGMWRVVSGSTLYFPINDLLGNSSVFYNNGDSAFIAKLGSG